jgi:DNA-binding response OmpR family regulator
MSRILIAEDSSENRYLLKLLLEHQGHTVLTCENGKECIEKAKASIPDLILMDVKMPEMDGFEACKILKENSDTKGIFIILLTAAFPDVKNKVKGFDYGADDYLFQPIDKEELLARIRAALRIKTMQDEVNRLNKELQQKIAFLEGYRKATVGRERKVMELEKEIEELKVKLSEIVTT